MGKFKEMFKVRPTTPEENEWVITIGNHLATEERFATKKQAEQRINVKDWDLIASMIFACMEAVENEKKDKEHEKSI